jgi:hypothetical protein
MRWLFLVVVVVIVLSSVEVLYVPLAARIVAAVLMLGYVYVLDRRLRG